MGQNALAQVNFVPRTKVFFIRTDEQYQQIWEYPLMSESSSIETTQAGDTYRLNTYICDHRHDDHPGQEYTRYFSINIPDSGQYVYHSPDGSHSMYRGTLLIEKPETEYAISHYHNGNDRTTFVTFCPRFYRELLSYAADTGMGHQFLLNREKQVYTLLSTSRISMLHAVLNDEIHSEFGIGKEVAIYELLDELLCSDETGSPTDGLPEVNVDHLEKVDRAKSFITAHLSEDLSLDQIAGYVYCSTFHFCRIFRKVTGYTPYRYLLEQRLEYAALLLKNTLESVTRICFESGFNHPEHFSSFFRKYHQLSPSQYRSRGEKSQFPVSRIFSKNP